MPDHVNPVDVDTDPITLHKIMIDSREYNYLQNQINLKSQLNLDVWDQYPMIIGTNSYPYSLGLDSLWIIIERAPL